MMNLGHVNQDNSGRAQKVSYSVLTFPLRSVYKVSLATACNVQYYLLRQKEPTINHIKLKIPFEGFETKTSSYLEESSQ